MDSQRQGTRTPRTGWWLWLGLTGLLSANELGWNLFRLWQRFRDAKVLNSLSAEAEAAMRGVVLETAGMVALAVLLLAGVAAVASSVILGSRDALAPRLRTRAARLAFRAAALFVVLNVWYSLHHVLVPSSRLDGSPLSVLSGALLPRMDGMEPARMVASVVCAFAFVAGLVVTLVRSPRSRRRFGLATALLLTGVLGYSAATDIGTPQRFSAPGSVVVLGMDSLQNNRLGVGGHPHSAAPRVDAFMADAQRFESAWTPFARTYPSWVSILSGRYPMNHGIRFNLLPDAYLAPDNHYLGEVFQQHGYNTLHATDETRFSIIRPFFGYDRMLHPEMGVTDFMVAGFFDFSAANVARQTHLGHDLFPAIANNRAAVGYEPAIWTRNLLRELNALPADEPVFVTAHLCADHWPFTASARHYWTEDDPIDASIAMLDEQVGTILDYLDDSGLAEQAVTVLLSDHGDGWSGDPLDTANTHGDHLERLLANQVVLGFRGPGLRRDVTSELVRTIDVYPTVLELVGLPVPGGLDGRSLVPLMRGEHEPPRELFAESGFDKKTFTVAKLIEEQSRWYDFDPRSGLVTLIPDGLDELYDGKQYMLLERDLRLLLVPARGELRLLRVDPVSGVEHEAAGVPDEVRADMLRRLAEHYELELDQVLDIAARRGFPSWT